MKESGGDDNEEEEPDSGKSSRSRSSFVYENGRRGAAGEYGSGSGSGGGGGGGELSKQNLLEIE